MNGLTAPVAGPRIGGRLEEAGPAHAVAKTDRLAIVVLLALAAAVHGWLFANTPIPARDGLSFSRLALQLERPSRIAATADESPSVVDVLKKAEQPPGYPLALLAVSKIVRAVDPITIEDEPARSGQLGERMLLSGQIAGCLAATLLVLPTFLLGRLLAGRFAGFATATIVQVLPVAAHVTSDCLSEGLYLLLLSTALWLGARGFRRGGLGNFLAAGLVAGLTYLVRPEGLLVAIAIGTGALGQGLVRLWPRAQATGAVLALFVGTALTAGPYMLMIGGISNKPSGLEFLKRAIFGSPREKMAEWEKAQAGGSPALFAAWASGSDGMTRAKFAVTAVAAETAKSAHYVVVPLALFGVWSLRRRIASDAATRLFAIDLIFHLGLLMLFAAKIGYVSERHTLPVVVVLACFAGAAIRPLLEAIARVGPFVTPERDRWFVLVAVAAACLPSTLRPLHQSRVGLKKAGEYLRTVVCPGDVVVDPFSWAEFYAGMSVTKLGKTEDPERPHYVVLPGPADPSPHDRLPKMRQAKDVAAAGSVVYRWPVDAPPQAATVLVVKTVPGR